MNAKIFGFFAGAIGGAAYGVSLDVASRCINGKSCAEELQASQSTSESLVYSHTADLAEYIACDGPNDESMSCLLAQGASAIAGMNHFINMLSYYPVGMTMAFAGAALGLAIGTVVDFCLGIDEEKDFILK